MITDPAYQALQELNNLKLENLPYPVAGGTYQFVLQVCAVGPAEFAYYAAQLGLDPQQYSDPSAPLGILINHITLRQGGKLYDFDLFNLKPGDTISASKMSGYSSPQTGDESTRQPDVDGGRGHPGVSSGFSGGNAGSEFDRLGRRLRWFERPAAAVRPEQSRRHVHPEQDPDAAVAALQRLYRATVGGNFSYYSTAEINKNRNLQALMINLFFYGFLVLITLIGVTNIINTLDSNIKLRRREIAMLKSVGLTPGGFRRMLQLREPVLRADRPAVWSSAGDRCERHHLPPVRRGE